MNIDGSQRVDDRASVRERNVFLFRYQVPVVLLEYSIGSSIRENGKCEEHFVFQDDGERESTGREWQRVHAQRSGWIGPRR